MEQIHCHGCGVQIQTHSEKELGYAPLSALEREDVICKRCFRLKNYNEVQDVDLTDDDFLAMLHEIGDRNGLVVNIVDLFDVHGSFVRGLNRLVGDNEVVLVGNKVDLLPKSINHNKVKNWMKRVAKEFGLKVKEVYLVSSVKGINMEETAFELEKIRKGKDIFVVGCTNVGKSTFINYLINRSIEQEQVITTSYFPGTTLGFIDIPLDDQSSMIDTPGIINDHQMAHYLSKKDLKTVTPKKEVKPKVFQLEAEQTLFIGGLARLDIDKVDEQKGFICYFSNDLNIHRTKTDKADLLYDQHLGELLSPPTEETIETWPELEAKTFQINSEKKQDIVFSGLGWITVPNGQSTVTAYVPKGVRVLVRDAII
ncbi:ribosome biogenesis GTPase YqeH [Alkalibacillus filiformis]|uniref:Ribosome biogenesis GTPase YqeH n=1 Tax=Alkalibacillus filiformis TaxID=200990 RepID=A0ABU0DRM0_9BACI|nr:ribosome biogenesis GTPase YqeH [Alkalibacillus filiformis]MDQ0351093.1 ribosome biogenesis GTPase YqeH [Alkalibacillus filiformis]